MNVFISYSTVIDQIIALRLQTMAAVYGMRVYVPPATTRQPTAVGVWPEVQKALNESKLVLAVITQIPVPSAISEMDFALQSKKLLIPIVTPNVPAEIYSAFPRHFLVNLQDPSQTEGEIVRFLAEQHTTERVETGGTIAVVALATLAIALLLFASQSD